MLKKCIELKENFSRSWRAFGQSGEHTYEAYPGDVKQRGFDAISKTQPHFERARRSFGDFQHCGEVGFVFPAFDVARRGDHDQLKSTVDSPSFLAPPLIRGVFFAPVGVSPGFRQEVPPDFL